MLSDHRWSIGASISDRCTALRAHRAPQRSSFVHPDVVAAVWEVAASRQETNRSQPQRSRARGPLTRPPLAPKVEEPCYQPCRAGVVDPGVMAYWLQRMDDVLSHADSLDNQIGTVAPFLCIGAFRHARLGAELVAQDITHVLNMAPAQCPNHSTEYYRPYRIVVQCAAAQDNRDFRLLDTCFSLCYDFIETVRRSGRQVLVHCFQVCDVQSFCAWPTSYFSNMLPQACLQLPSFQTPP